MAVKDFPFYEEEREDGWVYVGDGEGCAACAERTKQLEAQGKQVIHECRTCCHNDY